MKKISCGVFIFLAGLFPAVANAGALGAALANPDFQATLDAVSRSRRSLNEVRLLHLGGESWPARKKALANASRSLVQTVPFWMNDTAGDATLALYREKLQRQPDFQLRLIFDWASPLLSKDPLKTFQFARLESSFGARISYWNDPSWNVPWKNDPASGGLQGLLRHRIHEKALVIDGAIAIVGGMNVSDGHLRGGSEDGWRDDDLFIRGPLVREIQNQQLRLQALTEFFSSGKSLNLRWATAGGFLRDWLWSTDLGSRAGLVPDELLRIDARNKVRFPATADPREGEWTVPARLIYSNPLPEDLEGRGSESSLVLRTLKTLLAKAEKRVRLYLPYMSLSLPMRELFIATARRGVTVEIITNSESTNDVEYSYFAGVSHYLPLLDAGVRIYEWQGHQELKLRAAEGCPVNAWPGRTLHSKIVLIDDEVVLLGSHNLNVRSEHYNSEMTVLVEDPRMNHALQEIFDRDIREHR